MGNRGVLRPGSGERKRRLPMASGSVCKLQVPDKVTTVGSQRDARYRDVAASQMCLGCQSPRAKQAL